MLSVVIGRFQTPYLHNGHLELLDHALKMSERVLVLIGTTAAEGTDKNPLCFETRKVLFSNYRVDVKPLQDCPSDVDWSIQIDKIIEEVGFEKAVILGGRDNSIENYYSGKHAIKIISQCGNYSATLLRKAVGMSSPRESKEFREGVIHHVENRYPIVYSTVDIAILKYCDPMTRVVLMGKKGDKFHFIGGFVDKSDNDLLHAARREMLEETGIDTRLTYEFSMKIDDPRYKNTKDGIMTHLFCGGVHYRYPTPDLEKVADKEFDKLDWIELTPSAVSLVASHHQELFLKLINLKK
jgi:bifunctional NMN adenylyltransferase/nudix hydrolase